MSRFSGPEAGGPLPGGSSSGLAASSGSAAPAAPWSRVGPGPLGLLNSLLAYLVSARRAATDRERGGYCGLTRVHEDAGAGHGLSIAHTRSALFELEAYRLVESAGSDEPRWRATDAGITAMIAAAASAGQ